MEGFGELQGGDFNDHQTNVFDETHYPKYSRFTDVNCLLLYHARYSLVTRQIQLVTSADRYHCPVKTHKTYNDIRVFSAYKDNKHDEKNSLHSSCFRYGHVNLPSRLSSDKLSVTRGHYGCTVMIR